MKIIELNIGLASKTLGNLNPSEVLNALTGRGFRLINYRLQESTCRDGNETCLAIKTECPDDWQTQLARLSDKLGQDCIAVVGFIGRNPYDTFTPSLWVESVPALTSDDTGIVNGYTLNQFKSYLRETIIPDSLESGFTGYAEDLQTALDFLELQ